MATGIMESLFQRTLEDLVKGLRVQMIGESRYIANHLEEIRKEIKSTDQHTKAVALQKLTYINMLQGVDMEWAAFHVIEVMSMTKFEYKKIGYLAASQSFHEGIDVLLLVTNQIRKDLSSANEYEVGLALECLSCIATPDLAQELTPEAFALLASGRIYVRKRATLVIFKIFSKYPDAVRIACKRLVEKLEDSDPMVVCAAVSIFCEMAMKDPGSCVPLAPEFYRLLLDSKNNWLTIKVLKIFGVLTAHEPRLIKKIAEPLCEIMKRTTAKSLLLECVRTIITGLPDHTDALNLAVEKLKGLLVEEDPNLIFLGLQALAVLMPDHPWAVADNKSIIVRSLNDEDHSIQVASLQLILGMVTDTNVVETVQVLMQYAEKSHDIFRNELVGAVLATCSRGLYELVSDFSWYVSVLGNIARIPGSTHSKELERQFVDIGMRVKEVRGDLLAVARGILVDPTLLEHSSLHRVLSAVAWIAGEYVEYSANPVELIEALLQPRTKLLPSSVQAIYLQSVLKVFVYFSFLCLKTTVERLESESIVQSISLISLEESGDQFTRDPESKIDLRLDKEESEESVKDILLPANQSKKTQDEIGFRKSTINDDMLKDRSWVASDSLKRVLQLLDINVGPLVWCDDVEVQERACNLLGVVKVLREKLAHPEGNGYCVNEKDSMKQAFQMIGILREILSQDLGPVSIFAQSRVPLPNDLVLQDNLDSLDMMFQDDEKVAGNLKEWNIAEAMEQEWKIEPICTVEEQAAVKEESTGLLSQHRQQHRAYYLPVEKEPVQSDEYPPPQMVNLDVPSTSVVSEGIMKLAEQSSLWVKARQIKPRPVVIRLDDSEETAIIATSKPKKAFKDDIISSAIRDVLVGERTKYSSRSAGKETVLPSTSSQQHRRSHRKGRRSDKNGSEEFKVADGILGEETKRKSQKHKTVSATFQSESSKKGNHGRSHLHTGHKARHTSKNAISLSPQSAVIPDFLL